MNWDIAEDEQPKCTRLFSSDTEEGFKVLPTRLEPRNSWEVLRNAPEDVLDTASDQFIDKLMAYEFNNNSCEEVVQFSWPIHLRDKYLSLVKIRFCPRLSALSPY